jgi:hypothetical protein
MKAESKIANRQRLAISDPNDMLLVIECDINTATRRERRPMAARWSILRGEHMQRCLVTLESCLARNRNGAGVDGHRHPIDDGVDSDLPVKVINRPLLPLTERPGEL